LLNSGNIKVMKEANSETKTTAICHQIAEHYAS